LGSTTAYIIKSISTRKRLPLRRIAINLIPVRNRSQHDIAIIVAVLCSILICEVTLVVINAGPLCSPARSRTQP
jgi:hypothetical protein